MTAEESWLKSCISYATLIKFLCMCVVVVVCINYMYDTPQSNTFFKKKYFFKVLFMHVEQSHFPSMVVPKSDVQYEILLGVIGMSIKDLILNNT